MHIEVRMLCTYRVFPECRRSGSDYKRREMTGSGIFDYDPEPKLSATCLPVEKRLVRTKYEMTKTPNLIQISNTCICETLKN